MLWSTPSIGFVPHCRCDHRLAPITPVIVDHLSEPLIHDQVLVNLCDDTPPFFSRFQRLPKSSAPTPGTARPRAAAFASIAIAVTTSSPTNSAVPSPDGGRPPEYSSPGAEDEDDVLGKLDQLLYKHRPGAIRGRCITCPELTDSLRGTDAPAPGNVPTLVDMVSGPAREPSLPRRPTASPSENASAVLEAGINCASR